MTSPKHRAHGKLNLGHHIRIKGLREALEAMCAWDEVDSINPARCRVTHGQGLFRLKVQARTTTGLKLAAHGSGMVQEVFIVTSQPAGVAARIKREYER